MKVGKPISKRTPTRLRHKIEKASAAKQRKQRKLAKQNPQWRSRIKKDPGIPNLFPYKDRIMAEVEEGRRRKAEEQQQKRDEAKARRNGVAVEQQGGMDVEDAEEVESLEDDFSDEDEDGDAAMGDQNSSDPMAALLASARARAQDFDQEGDEEETDDEFSDAFERPVHDPNAQSTTPQSHSKTLNELISASDTLLHVLDARDPLATLSRPLTSRVTSDPSKRLLLILNKIDLVPTTTAQRWLAYLKSIFPVLPLIAAKTAPGAKTFDHGAFGWTAQSTAAGLLKALKAQAASKGMKRAVSIGVLGLPNVGKSSVINALSHQLGGRGKGDACPTGAEAGVTRALRVVKLDGSLKILDGPGVVLPASESAAATGETSAKRERQTKARLALLSALPPAQIDDPMPSVNLLLKRLEGNSEQVATLQNYYGIPAILPGADATTDFLVQVARKRGRLGKGGVPNLHAAALTVLGDWRDGRVAGWVEAPEAKGAGVAGGLTQQEGEVRDQKKLVNEWADEFKIEGLWNDRPANAALPAAEEVEMAE